MSIPTASEPRGPARRHLHDELASNPARVRVETAYGPVVGGRAENRAAVFLEVPYALPPRRFQDPEPLPRGYKYDEKEFISEAAYCAQPTNDGQAAGMPFEDKVGLGKPTEDCLLLNIICPPQFPSHRDFPVKVYIHGGFLQFGSPHGLSGQAQHIAAARDEVWVNIGYRLSALGFLACDEPHVDGNFGFKDVWAALLWIQENISAFGGDPEHVMVTGLSAGAHIVHQILHQAARLPEGQKAPFRSAMLQSNAMLTPPKTPTELRAQYAALCTALDLNPSSPSSLDALRDPARIPASRLTDLISSEALGAYGTFRGTLGGSWWSRAPPDADPMAFQHSGELGAALRARGVRSIVLGDLSAEWYLYSIAHNLTRPWSASVKENLDRYYPPDVVHRMLELYDKVGEELETEEAQERFGRILADGQVHLPVRILARDLRRGGMPVVKYAIRWAPEKVKQPHGHVTHGTDRALWALRLPALGESESRVAQEWLDAVKEATQTAEAENGRDKGEKEMLVLDENTEIGWEADARWDEVMRLVAALPGEQ